eukprot:SAG11_NODE_1672_length_4483_cov_3.470119_6_plen_105_part_00
MLSLPLMFCLLSIASEQLLHGFIIPLKHCTFLVLFLPVVFGPSRSTLKAHKVGLGRARGQTSPSAARGPCYALRCARAALGARVVLLLLLNMYHSYFNKFYLVS